MDDTCGEWRIHHIGVFCTGTVNAILINSQQREGSAARGCGTWSDMCKCCSKRIYFLDGNHFPSQENEVRIKTNLNMTLDPEHIRYLIPFIFTTFILICFLLIEFQSILEFLAYLYTKYRRTCLALAMSCEN